MKGKFKKFVAAFAAATVLMGLFPSMEFAAAYNPVSGTTMNVDNTLVLNDDANVPGVTFNFTVSPSAEGASLTQNIREGVTGVKFDGGNGSYDMVFETQTKTAAQTSYGTADFSDEYNSDESKYTVKKTMTLDFSGCSFTEPGIYRYKLQEFTVTGAHSVTKDEAERYIDVYVVNDENSSNGLKIDSYILHKSDSEGKNDSFVSDYESCNLSFKKEVTGNQASRDKYFKFTVKVTEADLNDDHQFNISGQTAEPEKAGSTAYTAEEMAVKNSPSAITGAELNAGRVIYVKSGETITITGIPKNVDYSVTELFENYTPSVVVNDGSDAVRSDGTTIINDKTATELSVSDDKLENNTSLTFTNNLSGTLPTGIIMSVAPAAAVGVIVLAAIIAIIVAGKKRELEEE